MRRLSRLDRSIDLLRHRPTTFVSSPFLCAACRRRPSFSTSTQRDAQKGSLPRTERLRRRIWGTDEPPGMEDPYGGPSLIEQRKAAKVVGQGEEVKESHPELSTTAAPETDPSYEPATSWDGLNEVGGEQVEEFYFEGFIPAESVSNTHEAVAAVHRAVVEVFSAKQSGRPFSDLSKIGSENDKTYAVEITGSSTAPVLQFKDGLSEETILKPMIDQETQEQINQIDGNSSDRLEALQFVDYEKQVASWDPAWLQISLEDPEVKFAIFKRVTQLTGIRIPDSAVESARTVNSLLNRLTTPPKPTKLVEALAQKEQLTSLPNVKIFGRRITPIDKEISVGRWKLIEKELSRRGLPVTGH